MANTSFPVGQRRGGRITQELPIGVSGTDVNGRDFIVPTRTLVLSRYGAKIFLSYALGPEQEISIYCPPSGKNWIARVVGLFTRESAGYTYGIEFLDQDANIWNFPYTPAPGSMDGVSQTERTSAPSVAVDGPHGSAVHRKVVSGGARKADAAKDYAVRLKCPHGDEDQWLILPNRDEPLKQILDTPWDFECPVHGVQREFPLEATETRLELRPRPQEKKSKGFIEARSLDEELLSSVFRRQECRIVEALRVSVRGVDRKGNPFIQSAYSIDISRNGGRLEGLGFLAYPGTTIEVRRRWRKARFRVVWTGQMGTPQANEIGICCLEPDKNFWGVPEAPTR